MTVAKGFATMLASVVICSGVGAVVGYAIGRLLPAFFRAMLPGGGREDADPIQVGIGLGLVNGIWLGVAVGGVIVACVTWYSVRCEK